MKLLLLAGANVHAVNRGGKRPLHIAAEKNHTAVAILLLLSGADVLVEDRYKITPFSYSTQRRWGSIMLLCLSMMEVSIAEGLRVKYFSQMTDWIFFEDAELDVLFNVLIENVLNEIESSNERHNLTIKNNLLNGLIRELKALEIYLTNEKDHEAEVSLKKIQQALQRLNGQ